MSDMRLFRVEGRTVAEMPGRTAGLERDIQSLVEANSEELLGVRFLESEYPAGQDGGIIDTLGIDENHRPVIIEYKRRSNPNIINQGLSYLNWLMEHRSAFSLRVRDTYGREIAEGVDWRNPRLLCIAGGFSKQDTDAVRQMGRAIDLIRYALYDDDVLLLELAHAAQIERHASAAEPTLGADTQAPSSLQRLRGQASERLLQLLQSLTDSLLSLGEDTRMTEVENYYAFIRMKNFACVRINPQLDRLVVTVKVDPDTVTLEEGFSRDMRGIGHLGTGDLAIYVTDADSLVKAQPLLARSYGAS
jgi:predicted transport protein